jgi:spermidine synthase
MARIDPSTSESSGAGSGKISAVGRWLLLAYAVSGAAALVYEVAWMRVLGDMLGSTAFASGTMLAAFMTGLGIGSLLGGSLARRVARPLHAAALAEVAVAACSVVALAGLAWLPPLFFDLLTQARVSPLAFFALQFAACFAVMLLPTIAMGTTFPLIMEAVGKRSRFGRWSGMLYTANTGGAIIGSLAAGFLLIPLLRVKGTLILAAVLSLAAACLLSWLAMRAEKAAPLWRSWAALVAAAALVCVVFVPASPSLLVGLTSLDRFGSSAEAAAAQGDVEILFDDDGIYSRVSVLKYADGSLALRNGAMIEGSNTAVDRRTTALLAALPLAAAQTQSSSLVVGLGTGYTPQVLLALGTPSVTTVEINPAVVTAAQYFAGKTISGDPRWRLVIDDARAHLLTTNESYDLITSEPSWPISSAVAPLFTREFMAAARTRLNPGGVFCQWLPNYLLTQDDVKMMYKTMRQVYDRVDVWSVLQPTSVAGEVIEGELILIGFTGDDPRSQADIGVEAVDLASVFGITKQSIQPYSGIAALEAAVTDPAVPVNTDDHTLLGYRVLWNLLSMSDGGVQ